MITLKIPVPTYLYKYLISLYGEEYVPSMYDELGVVVLATLEKSFSISKDFKSNNWKGKSMDNNFVIHLNYSQFKNNGFHIYPEKIHYLQVFIDNQFRYSMYRTAILNNEKFKISYKDTITQILAGYGITEEEFSYESIRKDFNRKADEIRKNLY
ncbi:hypothetical protein ACILFS_00915 [Capnocytophaga canimorsus]|uniref:hypothetical protein n=1 Tax=Capnocytophaga canimorsus TaxID=28188 RepID=UPI0037D94BFA